MKLSNIMNLGKRKISFGSGRAVKIAIVSDLHTEYESYPSSTNYSDIGKNADIIVLAGDIGTGTNALPLISRLAKDKPVVYVLGNHEFYRHNVGQVYKDWHDHAAGIPNLHVLQNETADIYGIRFIGATLWTNLAEGRDIGAAKYLMNDYNRIEDWTPRRSMLEFEISKNFIQQELKRATQVEQPTVVVTHHLPTFQAIHPDYQSQSGINSSFASDLEAIILDHQPLLWIFGHTHKSMNFTIGQTRLLCNPRGYPQSISSSENPLFDLKFQVEVGGGK